MFLSTYEEFRERLIKDNDISSLIQLEYNSFEAAVVPVCTFTMRNYSMDLEGEYIRLNDFKGINKQHEKTLDAIENPTVEYRFRRKNKDFSYISGSPIAFWVSDKIRNLFLKEPVGKIADIRKGLSTGRNAKFIRQWFEVNLETILINKHSIEENITWVPLKKGGSFRKWYGNQNEVILWEENGRKLKEFSGSVIRNSGYYFKESISWTMISNSKLGMRYYPENFIFEGAGPSIFPKNRSYMYYLLAFLCSKVAFEFRNLLNPTMNINIKDIEKLPFLTDKLLREKTIKTLANNNVRTSMNDWNSFELSWNFEKHPLCLFPSTTIKSSFNQWQEFAEAQFNQLRKNEEELNRIFIDIYCLQDELTPDVEDEDVTVSKANLERDIKSFISYAVGCMLGRYSLDEDGLVYAGGEFDSDRYKTFPADENNILPILPGAYFEDDIVNRFINFVEVTYGKDTLEENLDFIARAVGQRRNETVRETIRRYFLMNFYQDHVQTYKRTPIYWLFTSGRERAFNCLIYMHRYDKTTLSRIRTDYLHEVQTRYDSERQDLQTVIDGESTTKEIRDARREIKSVERKLEELKGYDEKLHHLADMQIEIDLDDGVRENYKKFEGLVARL